MVFFTDDVWWIQEEWQRMGFHGEFQGTGQFGGALEGSHASRGMRRGRCLPFLPFVPLGCLSTCPLCLWSTSQLALCAF